MNGDDQRQIGALMAEVANLKVQIADLSATTHEIRDAFVSLQGGWKVMLVISAIIGAGVGWLIQLLPLWWHK